MVIDTLRKASIHRLIMKLWKRRPKRSGKYLPGIRRRFGHRRHRPAVEPRAGPTPIWSGALGTVHGLGQAAQSCLSRQRLLWENGDLRAAEDYTALAAKRSLLAALQQQPRKGAQPVD